MFSRKIRHVAIRSGSIRRISKWFDAEQKHQMIDHININK